MSGFVNNIFIRLLTPGFVVLLFSAASGTETAAARDAERPLPTKSGFSLSLGHIYDPNPERDQFAMLTGFVTMDHDRAAFFLTPDFLRFKLEASAGYGRRSPWRTMASVNMLTLCYIDQLATNTARPYIEGGIGVFYTEERWDGQGLHVMHNPVAGAGVHVSPQNGGRTYQISIRFSHASNGGLHRDNKAMNAVMLSTGIMF